MIVGEAFISINADSSDLAAQVKGESDAALAGVGADAEAAGASMGDGIAAGVAGSDLAKSGEAAGADIAGGVGVGARAAEQDVAKEGSSIGEKLVAGFGSAISGIGTVLTRASSHLGPLEGGVNKLGSAMKDTESKGSGFMSGLANIGGKLAIGASVGLLAVGAVSVKLGIDYQATTAKLAASAGISVQAATSIGKAFLDTGGKTIYSAQQQVTALSSVAGELGATEGHALRTATAMKVMGAAGNLAEGANVSLTVATTSLVGTMQAFGIKATGAAKASDVLFSTARLTGISVTGVAQAVTKMHTKLGAVTPPLGQISSLLVDLKEHGQSGRGAISSLSAAMTALLKPTQSQIAANMQLNTLSKQLTPTLQSLAKSYASGTMTSSELSKATSGLSIQQQQLFSQWTAATKKVQTLSKSMTDAGLKVTNASGSFVGMGSIIAQLNPKIAGMGKTQAIATLAADGLGKSAAKLYTTIKAGVPAYDKAQKAVEKHNAAEEAAKKQASTLAHQAELLKAQVVDLATKFGVALLPKLEAVGKVLLKVAGYIIDHKPILIALGILVGGVLVGAFTAWAASLFMAGGALEFLMGPIGLLILVIAAVGVAIYEIATHWKQIWTAIKEVATAVWHSIYNDALHPIIDFFTKTIPHAFDTVVSFLEKWGPTILEYILAPFTGFATILVPLIASHWNDIVSFFESIPGKLLSAISAFGSMLVGWMDDAWHALEAAVATALSVLYDVYVKIPAEIISKIAGFAGMLVSWALSAFSSLLGAVVSGWDSVAGWFAGIPGRVMSFFSGAVTWLVHAGEDIVTGAWNGIKSVWNDVTGWFGKVKTAVLGIFHDAGTWLVHVGMDILHGLAVGLVAAAQATVGNIPIIGGTIVNEFKSALGVHSPSVIFAAMGVTSMKGLSMGFDTGYEKHVAPSLAKASSGILRSLGATTSGAATGNTHLAAGGTTHVTTLTIAQGAVKITVPTGAHADAASQAVTDAFTKLAKTLGSGQAPLRINR